MKLLIVLLLVGTALGQQTVYSEGGAWLPNDNQHPKGTWLFDGPGTVTFNKTVNFLGLNSFSNDINLLAPASVNFGFTNNASGTSNGSLVKLVDVAGTITVSKTATSDTNNAYGCVQSGAGTSGTSQVASLGFATCLFDNSTVTDGDFIIVSTTVAGTLGDSGSGTAIPNVLNLGKALGSHAPCGAPPCGPYTVVLQTPDAAGAGGALPTMSSTTTGKTLANNGSAATWGGQTLDCSQFSGADNGTKIQNCLIALASINSIAGIADARALVGGTWAVNPFAASSIPNSGRLLIGPGTITVNNPIVAHPEWSIEGMHTRSVDGQLGSVLKAAATFPVTYTTGTVTMGTPGNNEIITGVGTGWVDNINNTGNIAVGCQFVSPAGGGTNSTFGVIRTITDATHITLGFGINNGTGAPGGSTYDIYCPVYIHGDGGTTGDQFGMAAIDVGFDANSKTGVIPEVNWYGEQGSFADNVGVRNFCGIGLDIEARYQNSGPWNRVIVSPSSTCAAAGTMNIVVRGNLQPFFGITNYTGGRGAGATTPTQSVDLEGDYITLDGADIETTGIGVNLGAGPACLPACALPQKFTGGVHLRNIYGIGTTLVNITSGQSDSTTLENLSGNSFTNILVDGNTGCTIATATENRLALYATDKNAAIAASSSTAAGCHANTTLASVRMANLLVSATAPTISAGFGTSPSIASNNGTAAFTVNVGTGGTASTGTIGLPTAATGWTCTCTDVTTNSATVFACKQTGAGTTATVPIGEFTAAGAAQAWTASDILAVSCHAY